jgi:hypothetical protein
MADGALEKSVVFAAKRTLLFQKPPHERPGGDEVLLLRWYQPDDAPSESVGEFGITRA